MKLVSSYFTSDQNPIMIKHRLVFVFQIKVKLYNTLPLFDTTGSKYNYIDITQLVALHSLESADLAYGCWLWPQHFFEA